MTEVLIKIKLRDGFLLLLLEEIIVSFKEKCLYHFIILKVIITRRYIKFSLTKKEGISNQIILKGDYCIIYASARFEPRPTKKGAYVKCGTNYF